MAARGGVGASAAAISLLAVAMLAPSATAWVLVTNCATGLGDEATSHWLCQTEGEVLGLRCVALDIVTPAGSYKTPRHVAGCPPSYELRVVVDDEKAWGRLASSLADASAGAGSSRKDAPDAPSDKPAAPPGPPGNVKPDAGLER